MPWKAGGAGGTGGAGGPGRAGRAAGAGGAGGAGAEVVEPNGDLQMRCKISDQTTGPLCILIPPAS